MYLLNTYLSTEKLRLACKCMFKVSGINIVISSLIDVVLVSLLSTLNMFRRLNEQTFACLKSTTVVTVEKVMKYVQC